MEIDVQSRVPIYEQIVNKYAAKYVKMTFPVLNRKTDAAESVLYI